MSIAGGSFAAGALGTSEATLYGPVAVGYAAHITFFSLVNTGASARTVDIYVKRGSTSYEIIPVAYSLASGAGDTARLNVIGMIGAGLKLSAGDEIRGKASAATEVKYVIAGGTEA